jgi:hypothetical protein
MLLRFDHYAGQAKGTGANLGGPWRSE